MGVNFLPLNYPRITASTNKNLQSASQIPEMCLYPVAKVCKLVKMVNTLPKGQRTNISEAQDIFLMNVKQLE